MKSRLAGKTRSRVWLLLAILGVSAVFGTTIAYLIETLPSADPPHPLTVGRLALGAIAFTIMVSLLFAVAIPATRRWDRRATSWEALIGLTTVLVVGPGMLALLEHTFVKRGDSWAKAVALGLAAASYALVRWLYRRGWSPDAPPDASSKHRSNVR